MEEDLSRLNALSQSVVPTVADEPFNCPICSSFKRSGWQYYDSRDRAVHFLEAHLKRHAQNDTERSSHTQTNVTKKMWAPVNPTWERAKAIVPIKEQTPFKCPMCEDYHKSGWSECPSRHHAITNLFHHLQNHGDDVEHMNRSQIPPKLPPKNKHGRSQQQTHLNSTHSPTMEGDSDSSSDYEQEETTSSPSPIKAEPQIMALAPCDSESDEGELPTTRPRKFTAGTIVPRHGNIAYACPLCTNYSRPGWTHFVSRFSAINSLHVHLKTHLQAHTSTHRRRGRRQASLSEKVERLGGYLMAPPVYTEGVVPFCMQGTPHCHPNNLTQHQNGAVREQDIDILYQRMCCPCCCCHREAEHVNTIRKEPKHETQLACTHTLTSSQNLDTELPANQRDDNTTTKQLTQVLHSVSFPPCNHLRNQD